MSLILDALRKMEQDRKARRGGLVDIRPEVLSHRGKMQSTARKPLVLIAAGVILLSAGIGAGIILKEIASTKAPEPIDSFTQAAVAPEPQSVPIQPSAPVRPPQTVAVPARPEQPVAPVPVMMPTQKPPAKPVVEEPPMPAAGPASPTISVSGIAWQDERSLRRAVVNGSLVGEGAEVAGARVVEIGETRVRFSQGGRTFDISLSSAFPIH